MSNHRGRCFRDRRRTYARKLRQLREGDGAGYKLAMMSIAAGFVRTIQQAARHTMFDLKNGILRHLRPVTPPGEQPITPPGNHARVQRGGARGA